MSDMMPESRYLFYSAIAIFMAGMLVIVFVPIVSKDVVSLAVALFGVIGTHVGHVVGQKSARSALLSARSATDQPLDTDDRKPDGNPDYVTEN